MSTCQPLDFHISYKGRSYKINAVPQTKSEKQHLPLKFRITVESYLMGALVYKSDKWQSDNIIDQELVDMIGSNIQACNR
jgi:hypothetical protein